MARFLNICQTIDATYIQFQGETEGFDARTNWQQCSVWTTKTKQSTIMTGQPTPPEIRLYDQGLLTISFR